MNKTLVNCQSLFSACNAHTYSRLHKIFAAMKLLIIVTVLLVLLGNSSVSNGLTPYQKMARRLMFTSSFRMHPGLPKPKKTTQRKPRDTSPMFELHAPAKPDRTKIKVCKGGLILINVMGQRKYCPSGITYARL